MPVDISYVISTYIEDYHNITYLLTGYWCFGDCLRCIY